MSLCSPQGELQKIQDECTNPRILACIKKKLSNLRRKHNSRRTLWSSSPISLRTSVYHTLQQLDNEPQYLAKPPISPRIISNPPSSRTSEKTIQLRGRLQSLLPRLRKSHKHCQDRISLLSSLQTLRQARQQQFRSQGGLFPDELDKLFQEKIVLLKNELEAKRQYIQSQEKKIEKISNSAIKSLGTETDWNGDFLGFTDVPLNILQILFGPLDRNPKNHQIQFYCQANRNFADFIRIRFGWDKFLQPIDDSNLESSVASFNRTDPSKLPEIWHLPPKEVGHLSWSSFLQKSTNDSST